MYTPKPETPQAEINTRHLKLNDSIHFQTNHRCEWVRELLNEVNAAREDEDHGAIIAENSFLEVDFTLNKKTSSEHPEYITIKGIIKTTFWTYCIRCLQHMPETLKIDLKACFVPEKFEHMAEYKDQITVYADNEEMDLYFYKQSLNLRDFLQEQISINIDPLPLHSESCMGLCQMCGHNLNEGSCAHLHSKIDSEDMSEGKRIQFRPTLH
ncbi:MAG: DUF177 domain-containing protein [Oligoflexia bacterium]|nr:DUF177 domain-containing protein [Oligoflexia bacterium]